MKTLSDIAKDQIFLQALVKMKESEKKYLKLKNLNRINNGED